MYPMPDNIEVTAEKFSQEGKDTFNIVCQNCGGWNNFAHDTKVGGTTALITVVYKV